MLVLIKKWWSTSVPWVWAWNSVLPPWPAESRLEWTEPWPWSWDSGSSPKRHHRHLNLKAEVLNPALRDRWVWNVWEEWVPSNNALFLIIHSCRPTYNWYTLQAIFIENINVYYCHNSTSKSSHFWLMCCCFCSSSQSCCRATLSSFWTSSSLVSTTHTRLVRTLITSLRFCNSSLKTTGKSLSYGYVMWGHINTHIWQILDHRIRV